MNSFKVRLGMLCVLLGHGVPVFAETLGCLIEPDKVAEVGAPAIGVINRIAVERGDYVNSGQVLISMKDEIESASRNVASARAQLDAEIKAAQVARDLAQAKVKRSRDLVSVGFISKEALDQAEAELQIAQNRVFQAQETRKVSKVELDLSNAVLSQRSIRSPFAGLVMERYRTEGERIEREPILRIAKVDPLRVEVVLSFAQYGQIKAGDVATVKSGLPDAPALKATVSLVDRMVDSASNTFRVRLALPNPGNKIPPGLRCSIAFEKSAGGDKDPLPAPTAKLSSSTNNTHNTHSATSNGKAIAGTARATPVSYATTSASRGNANFSASLSSSIGAMPTATAPAPASSAPVASMRASRRAEPVQAPAAHVADNATASVNPKFSDSLSAEFLPAPKKTAQAAISVERAATLSARQDVSVMRMSLELSRPAKNQ